MFPSNVQGCNGIVPLESSALLLENKIISSWIQSPNAGPQDTTCLNTSGVSLSFPLCLPVLVSACVCLLVLVWKDSCWGRLGMESTEIISQDLVQHILGTLLQTLETLSKRTVNLIFLWTLVAVFTRNGISCDFWRRLGTQSPWIPLNRSSTQMTTALLQQNIHVTQSGWNLASNVGDCQCQSVCVKNCKNVHSKNI